MGLELIAKIGLDGTGFESGLNKIRGQLNSLGGMVAGAFSIGAIAGLTKKTLDYAGHLNDLSDRLGVSTDFLQEFRYVAQQTGTDLEKLTKVIETLNASRDVALAGGAAGAKNLSQFQALGVSESALRSKRMEDLISGPIASAIQGGDVQGKIGAAWKSLGGKGAGELVAGFKDGFNEGRKAARAAGHIWSEDVIQQLDEIGDRFAVLGDVLLVEWGGVILKLIDMLKGGKGKIATFASGLGAATASYTPKELAVFFATAGLFKPKDKPLDYQSAADAELEAKDKAQLEQDQEFEARRKRRELRNKDRTPGNVEASFTEPLPKAPHERSPGSEGDALVRVGNFLGSSQSTLSRIGERTNQLLYSIDQRLSTMKASGGIQFPST